MRTIEFVSTPAQYKWKMSWLMLLAVVMNRTILVMWGCILLGVAYTSGEAWPLALLKTLGLIAGGVVVALPFTFSKTVRMLLADPLLLGPYKVSLQAEGIRWVTSRSDYLQQWSLFTGVWKLFGNFILFTKTGLHTIPLRAFSGPEEIAEWDESLRRHIREAK